MSPLSVPLNVIILVQDCLLVNRDKINGAS